MSKFTIAENPKNSDSVVAHLWSVEASITQEIIDKVESLISAELLGKMVQFDQVYKGKGKSMLWKVLLVLQKPVKKLTWVLSVFFVIGLGTKIMLDYQNELTQVAKQQCD